MERIIDQRTVVEKDMVTQGGDYRIRPDLWSWYFSWHPKVLLTGPAFIWFGFCGLWFIYYGIGDLIYFFQDKGAGGIAVALILGSLLLTAFAAPVYICFLAIDWLYQLNVSDASAWRKFAGSIGLFLLVTFGGSIIRIIVLYLLGITERLQ